MLARALLALTLAGAVLVPASSQAAAFPPDAGRQGKPAVGTGVDLTPVSNWSYRGGTDLEFATVRGRDYAVVPSEAVRGGTGALRIFDLTASPAKPPLVGFLPCHVTQNDVQVRGTTVFMGVDGSPNGSQCFSELGETPALGVMAISIANPRNPRPVGFIRVKEGAHNTTIHPGGRYLYVSDSELFPTTDHPSLTGKTGRITIVDVRDPANMLDVRDVDLPLGLSSHDISFNRNGTRAYSAALTQTVILNTTKPSNPTIITTILDPAVNISHGADLTPDETHLLVTDEQAGAAANGVCNVGGVHIYDIRVEQAPVKTGYYPFSPLNSLGATMNSGNDVCTAHVLDYGPTGKTFSNAGYAAGVRIVDVTPVALDVRLGIPDELASFTALDADTWSAKQYKDQRYLYANDLQRGFDVFRYTPGKGAVDNRSAKQKRFDVRRLGITTFGKGAWCAEPQGAASATHH